jgi:hypothetical protein
MKTAVRAATMIIGAHSIIYSTNPEADRAFLRNVLKLPHIDVGHGWLIFGLPPAEVAVHPALGPSGGQYYWFGLPYPGSMGTGGCQGCIAVIIKCSTGVAVYHFTGGDDAACTLGVVFGLRLTSWSGCKAIVCGGDDSRDSNCLADEVLSALSRLSVAVDGVSGKGGCGVNPDGSWYEGK